MNYSSTYTCFYDRKITPIVDVIVMIVINIIYVGISGYAYNYYYKDGVMQYSWNISISVYYYIIKVNGGRVCTAMFIFCRSEVNRVSGGEEWLR